MWSFDLHDLQHGVVQLLDACENIPHLLHWYTWVLFSYGVTVQLKLNNLTNLRLSRVFLSFLEVRLMTMDTNCLDWMSSSKLSHFGGLHFFILSYSGTYAVNSLWTSLIVIGWSWSYQVGILLIFTL